MKPSLIAEAIEQEKPSPLYTYILQGHNVFDFQFEDDCIIIRSPVRLTVREEKPCSSNG